MQEKYIKDILTKINSEKLVKDQLKKIWTTKLEKTSRRKLGNKIVQKGEVITVGKAQKKNINKRANKVTIVYWALI